MSAREYKTSTLVNEIRFRGLAVAGVEREDVWLWSGHNWTVNQCHEWIEKHRNGIEDAMRKAAEDYFIRHWRE